MSSISQAGGIIYMLTSPSKKSYVGQTWDWEKRAAQYRGMYCEKQAALYAALVKHKGLDAFVIVFLHTDIQTQEELDALEVAEIKRQGTLSPGGYNLTAGGNGGKRSDETKAKIAEARRGKKHTPERRANISKAMSGKKLSPEHKAKLSASNTGKPKSLAHRAKISASKRGERNPNFGKSPSLETRAKQSAAVSGERHPNFGKTLSPKHRAAISAGRRAGIAARKLF